MRIAQLLLGGLATVGSVGAASLNATDADAPIKQIGYEADLCGAAVAPTEDGTGDLVLVAVGVSGQPFARRVGSDGRVQSGWVAAPPAASAGRAGPTLVAMPRGGGILCVLCDEGSLFTSIIHTDGRGLEWGAWRAPPGAPTLECAHAPAVVSDPRTGLHVFAVRSADRMLVHGCSSSVAAPLSMSFAPIDAHAPAPLDARGGSSASAAVAPPAAALDAAGSLRLVVRGIDGTLFHRQASQSVEGQGWTWTTWQALDGRVRGAPQLLTRRKPAHMLNVFGRGLLDSSVYRINQAPSNVAAPANVHGRGRSAWQRRQPLGGLMAAAPVAAEDARGTVHVLGLGPDGTTWHRAFSAAGGPTPPTSESAYASEWSSLGGEAATAPLVAIRPDDGLLSVIVGDIDGTLHLKPMVEFKNNGTVGWGAWATLGGPVRPFAC